MRHERRRAWKRTITRTRDPNRAGFRPAAYLFADRVELEPERLDKDEFAAG